jgi:hypothetical protein
MEGVKKAMEKSEGVQRGTCDEPNASLLLGDYGRLSLHVRSGRWAGFECDRPIFCFRSFPQIVSVLLGGTLRSLGCCNDTFLSDLPCLHLASTSIPFSMFIRHVMFLSYTFVISVYVFCGAWFYQTKLLRLAHFKIV